MPDRRRRKRPRLRRRRKRDRAEDALECGCCLADALTFWAVAAGAVVIRRRRR